LQCVTVVACCYSCNFVTLLFLLKILGVDHLFACVMIPKTPKKEDRVKMITLGGKHYLEESDLAKILNRTVQTVRVWRYAHMGPPYMKIGSVTLYPEEEVQKWIDARAKRSGGNNG